VRCYGVPKSTDPETYLRLACERTLLSVDSGNGMPGAFEGAVISRVLGAAGTLPAQVGLDILDEYQLAMVLRDGRRGRMLMHRQAMAQVPRQRLSVQRVVVGDRDIEHGKDRWTLERLLFADDVCHLTLSGAEPAGASRSARRAMTMARAVAGGRPNQPNPATLVLTDDVGTTATARAGHASWGGGSWSATYTTDKALSANTQWIELDGIRLDLPERTPEPAFHVENVEPIEPLRRVLYAEILSTDRRHGGADTVEIACRALIATGAFNEDDPTLGELRRIADAVTNATPAPGLPEPWASLVARYPMNDGVIGSIPIGVAIDDLEGFSIRLDALISEPTSFSIALAMSPGSPLLRHFPGAIDLEPSAITWWAEDDRGNSYVAFPDRGGGGGNVAEGQVTSLASLDPKATELTLMPTGTRTRGVIAVPLTSLARRS
jgi:hypothetical protein